MSNTQLKVTPYKRPELRATLISLISHSNIRDVNPTTKRLVERCLSADWCKALGSLDGIGGHTLSAKASSADLMGRLAPGLVPPPRSASAEPILRDLGRLKLSDSPKSANGSTSSLTDVAGAPPPIAGLAKPTPPQRLKSPRTPTFDSIASPSSPPPLSPSRSSTYSSASEPVSHRTGNTSDMLRPALLKGMDPNHRAMSVGDSPGERRKAPVPPQKRRKPPAVPVRAPKVEIGHGGTTITTIASSSNKGNTHLTAHY